MRFFSITSILTLICLFSTLYGQKYQQLFDYYQNKQLDELYSSLEVLEKKDQNHPEIKFFRTTFSDNGDHALKVYQKILEESFSPLKNLVAIKLSEYYYARGFYIKAEDYKKLSQVNFPGKTGVAKKSVDNNSEKIKQTENKKPNQAAPGNDVSKYVIQVGAFGVPDNANELAEYLRTENFKVNVVDRIINGKTLYCVWIKGKGSYEATETVAKDIGNKYNLSYRILLQP
jgi:hypothetical protein